MWEFLGTTLTNYGVGTVVMLAVIAAAGYAMRELWIRNQEIVKTEGSKRRVMREAHEKEVEGLRVEIRELQTENSNLQERWRAETKDVVRELVQEGQATRTAVTKAADALVLLQQTFRRD